MTLAPRKLIVILLATLLPAIAQSCPDDWPQWSAYSRYFIQEDGRVIERSQKARTTSEGQAYSLFHALVANDRAAFERVLNWTVNNLARGDLRRHLPAWHWGRDDAGRWRILDPNPASDADMWLAYSLIEAGRLWGSEDYRQLGMAVLNNIEAREIRHLDGLGDIVVPGPEGFELPGKRWKLNPSYLPIQLLRRFAAVSPSRRWGRVLDATTKLLLASSASGIVPDWIIYAGKGKFELEPNNAIGSYDAIRVYLWLGMLNDADPLKSRLLGQLNFTSDSYGLPPERIDARSRVGSGRAPIGFKAALAPYFKAKNARRSLHRAIRMIDREWQQGLLADKPVYYDQNLALFALAWLEKRFSFAADGRLITQWKQPCTDAAGNSPSSSPAG